MTRDFLFELKFETAWGAFLMANPGLDDQTMKAIAGHFFISGLRFGVDAMYKTSVDTFTESPE